MDLIVNFSITYLLALAVCVIIGKYFYLDSDKGIFRLIGLVPIINIIVSITLLCYMMYILIDIYLIDRFRSDRNKKGQYTKILRLFTD